MALLCKNSCKWEIDFFHVYNTCTRGEHSSSTRAEDEKYQYEYPERPRLMRPSEPKDAFCTFTVLTSGIDLIATHTQGATKKGHVVLVAACVFLACLYDMKKKTLIPVVFHGAALLRFRVSVIV